MPTEKRQRQKAARQARLAAEARTRKRKQTIRRVGTGIVVLALIAALSLWLTHGSSKKSAGTPSTTTTVPAFAYTPSSAPGGSGNTSPSAITTSADCPASLGATLNKPTYPNGPTGAHIDTSKNYTATVTTDVGSFTIVLAPKAAPLAVNSFVFLARQHFFDCVVFHRVIPGFVDQTGDPTGTGTGGPGYKFADELPAKAAPQYPLGSVAMANAGPDTNGSQFFIVTGPPGETLPPSYTLFGRVTSGMNVVQKINADGTDTGAPNVEHRIISITISES